MKVELKQRKKYRVRDVIEDLKKIDATPGVTYDVGTDLVYFEYHCCEQERGSDDPITVNMKDFLDFLQHDYERQLLQGEISKTSDTPKAVFTRFAKDRPSEFLNFVLNRQPEYVFNVLQTALRDRKREIKKYKKAAKAEVKANPDDPDAWYKLRLVLWIVGEYKEASQAFQKAKRLGWKPETTRVVAI